MERYWERKRQLLLHRLSLLQEYDKDPTNEEIIRQLGCPGKSYFRISMISILTVFIFLFLQTNLK